MKGSFNKSYNYPIIVDEERLQYLSSLITEKLQDVYYKIETIDGATYKLSTLDEILSYCNPQSRKIIKLSITGSRESRANKIYPDISISLFDMSLYDKSCILSMYDREEQEITYLSQRIDEFVKSVRTPYWWLHSNIVYWLAGIILFIAATVVCYSSLEEKQLTQSMNNTLTWCGLSLVCFSFSGFVVRRCVGYLFPEGGFALGEQVKCMQKRIRIRNIIFCSILGSIMLGVVSGLIVYWITK